MSQIRKQRTLRVDSETAAILKEFSEASGKSITEILRDFAKAIKFVKEQTFPNEEKWSIATLPYPSKRCALTVVTAIFTGISDTEVQGLNEAQKRWGWKND